MLGRSIVFHDQAGASSRFTCANIIPDHFTYTFAFPATATFTRSVCKVTAFIGRVALIRLSRASFIDAVSGSLRISRTRVVILYNLDVPVIRAGCSKVMVAIAGGGEFIVSVVSQPEAVVPLESHTCIDISYFFQYVDHVLFY